MSINIVMKVVLVGNNGVGNLIINIIIDIEFVMNHEYHTLLIKVVLVGNAGVGKTCLVRRFTQVQDIFFFFSFLAVVRSSQLFSFSLLHFCFLLYLLLLLWTNLLFIFLKFFFCLLLVVVDVVHSLFLHIFVCLLFTPPEKKMNVTFRACSRLGKERL